MGLLQLHLTGGEPLARPDVEELVRAGRASNLYVNLITSGVGLAEPRLDALVNAGLDHIQLSFQDSEQSRPTNSPARGRMRPSWSWRACTGSTRRLYDEHGRPSPESPPALPEMIALAEERHVAARSRQRPILRMGASRIAASFCPRANRCRKPSRSSKARVNGSRPHAHRLRAARLLCALSKSLHGRLGTWIDAHRSRGRRVAVPCRRRDPRA